MKSKICRKCGPPAQPIENFNKNRAIKDGHHIYCKSCQTKIHREWCKENPERRAKHQKKKKLLSKYGLTLEQYDEMLEKQNHSCAICGIHESKQKNNLSVDHNHNTGKIRALLCSKCNTGLGSVDENPDILQAMIDYLRRYDD